jgi:hypothetical protein
VAAAVYRCSIPRGFQTEPELLRGCAREGQNLNIRVLPCAAALAVVFASTSMADIMGTTYHFSASTTGNTQISAPSGTFTDPANPGFCVGPPVACGSGSGVSGSFTFADTTPTTSTITFTFFGSTAGAGPGSFSIDLGNFVPDLITGITYGSGSLGGASATNSWDGTDAVFTFTTGSNYNAIGGNSVVFDVTQSAAVPEPSSILLLMTALGCSVAGIKKLHRKQDVNS